MIFVVVITVSTATWLCLLEADSFSKIEIETVIFFEISTDYVDRIDL